MLRCFLLVLEEDIASIVRIDTSIEVPVVEAVNTSAKGTSFES